MNLPSVEPLPAGKFDVHTETLIIGAGACGLVAALAAREGGQQVLVIESDAVPAGSTSLSAGLIPAADTRFQRELSVTDSANLFAHDIQKKADNQNDQLMVDLLASKSADVIEWLADNYGLPFSLVENFDYPGHSRRRMHGLPSRTGRELIDALRTACEQVQIDIVCNRRAVTLFAEERKINGAAVANTVDNGIEYIGCRKLILACNGYGGNRTMVANHMPQIAEALWFGHAGNKGEAVIWGQQLGAATGNLGSYQGHGNVAHPHGILISWAVIMQGGVQINKYGRRFWNETLGYSEAAQVVLAQPEGTAVTVFDERIAGIARQFEDFKQAERNGAVMSFNSLRELAARFELPFDAVSETIEDLPVSGPDKFGRVFEGRLLQSPFYAVRVTGALFHTQGGLIVDQHSRVKHNDGDTFENLYAGGGAACGVSGKADSGYLSGNGLLSAVVLGYQAGMHEPPKTE